MIAAEITRLVQDAAAWPVTRYSEAQPLFHAKTIAMYFDLLDDSIVEDAWQVRQHILPLPDATDGYARVLFLGKPGSGKTTLIRHLMGIAQTDTGFPAVSNQRTTTFPMEVIYAVTRSTAIVTFRPQGQIVQYIQDCLLSAVFTALAGKEARDIARSLLEHADQRFRLQHVLGRYRSEHQRSTTFGSGQLDHRALQNQLDFVIREVVTLAAMIHAHWPEDAGKEPSLFDEVLTIEWLQEQMPRFNDLTLYLLELIRRQFALVPIGEYQYDARGWPQRWEFVADDLATVLAHMWRFASIEWQQAGHVLTPIVSGIRIQGPFCPVWWHDDPPRLVLVDEEGIGHGTTLTSSLPLAIVERFPDVDVIALVDDASNALQDMSQVIIHDTALYGEQAKLVLAYTHVDEVVGPDIEDEAAREDKVRMTQHNVLIKLKNDLPSRLWHQVQTQLDRHCFSFAALNRNEPAPATLQETLHLFVADCLRIAHVEDIAYHSSGLRFIPAELAAVSNGAYTAFHDKWDGVLGLVSPSTYRAVNHMQVLALANRLARRSREISYRDLDPASDMVSQLMRHFQMFLSAAQHWQHPERLSEPDWQRSLDKVARQLTAHLSRLIVQRLKYDQSAQWVRAKGMRYGTGIARQRARLIAQIFEETLPWIALPDGQHWLQMLQEALDAALDAVDAPA